MEHQTEDVFTVPSAMIMDTMLNCWIQNAAAAEKDLRNDYASIELDSLKQLAEYVQRYGPSYMVMNLVWSEAAVLNSRSNRLRVKIDGQLD